MTANPVTQYADDGNLRARQRLWQSQQPRFDLVGWVLGLAGLEGRTDRRLLDVGCGNGAYLAALRHEGIDAVGCDLSLGMLTSASGLLINADVVNLPVRSRAFDVVLAPHMLYHVPGRAAAALELRRVLRHDGVCLVVTNGAAHMRSLRALVEAAVGQNDPGWVMRDPSTHSFSLENGGAQLEVAFDSVICVRPDGVAPVRIVEASTAADYVASVADMYAPDVTRPWADVVKDVREGVQQAIDRDGAFIVSGDTGAFVCG